MDDVLPGLRSRSARSAGLLALLAVLLSACATPPPTEPTGPAAPSRWDPEQAKIESSQQNAEQLGIVDPPEVEVIRFILPSEDSIWVSCLNEAGWDFSSAPGGGVLWPKDQRPEIMDAMNLAFYTCSESYPIDPKYFELSPA